MTENSSSVGRSCDQKGFVRCPASATTDGWIWTDGRMAAQGAWPIDDFKGRKESEKVKKWQFIPLPKPPFVKLFHSRITYRVILWHFEQILCWFESGTFDSG